MDLTIFILKHNCTYYRQHNSLDGNCSDFVKICQFWDTRYVEYEIRVQIRIQHPRVSMCTNFGRDIPIISLKNLHDNKFQIQIPHTQLSIGTNFGKNIPILAP